MLCLHVVGHTFDNATLLMQKLSMLLQSMVSHLQTTFHFKLQTIGEKLVVRRSALINGDDNTAVNGYVHSNMVKML